MREWLQQIRKQNHLNHCQMAKKCDISRSYYTHIENGTKTPAVELAKRIANLFQFDWAKFFKD